MSQNKKHSRRTGANKGTHSDDDRKIELQQSIKIAGAKAFDSGLLESCKNFQKQGVALQVIDGTQIKCADQIFSRYRSCEVFKAQLSTEAKLGYFQLITDQYCALKSLLQVSVYDHTDEYSDFRSDVIALFLKHTPHPQCAIEYSDVKAVCTKWSIPIFTFDLLFKADFSKSSKAGLYFIDDDSGVGHVVPFFPPNFKYNILTNVRIEEDQIEVPQLAPQVPQIVPVAKLNHKQKNEFSKAAVKLQPELMKSEQAHKKLHKEFKSARAPRIVSLQKHQYNQLFSALRIQYKVALLHYQSGVMPEQQPDDSFILGQFYLLRQNMYDWHQPISHNKIFTLTTFPQLTILLGKHNDSIQKLELLVPSGSLKLPYATQQQKQYYSDKALKDQQNHGTKQAYLQYVKDNTAPVVGSANVSRTVCSASPQCICQGCQFNANSFLIEYLQQGSLTDDQFCEQIMNVIVNSKQQLASLDQNQRRAILGEAIYILIDKTLTVDSALKSKIAGTFIDEDNHSLGEIVLLCRDKDSFIERLQEVQAAVTIGDYRSVQSPPQLLYGSLRFEVVHDVGNQPTAFSLYSNTPEQIISFGMTPPTSFLPSQPTFENDSQGAELFITNTHRITPAQVNAQNQIVRAEVRRPHQHISVEIAPKGCVDKKVLVALSQCGASIDANQHKKFQIGSGGHPNMRFLSDHAGLPMYQNLIRQLNDNSIDHIFIYDAGARYSKVSKNLKKIFFHLKPWMRNKILVYVPLRPQLADYDSVYNANSINNYNARRIKLRRQPDENNNVLILAPVMPMTVQDFQMHLLRARFQVEGEHSIYVQEPLLDNGNVNFASLDFQEFRAMCRGESLNSYTIYPHTEFMTNDHLIQESYQNGVRHMGMFFDWLDQLAFARYGECLVRSLVHSAAQDVGMRAPLQGFHLTPKDIRSSQTYSSVANVRNFAGQMRHQFWMNDVHYYLAEWRNVMPCTIHTSGMTFPVTEGSYNYFGEATCLVHTVNGRPSIMMKTRGFGKVYEHDNVRIDDPCWSIDFGFVQFNYKEQLSEAGQIPYKRVNYHVMTRPGYSPQAHYFLKLFSQINQLDLATINRAKHAVQIQSGGPVIDSVTKEFQISECPCMVRQRERMFQSSMLSNADNFGSKLKGAVVDMKNAVTNFIPVVNKYGIQCVCSPTENAIKHIQEVSRGLQAVDETFLRDTLQIPVRLFAARLHQVKLYLNELGKVQYDSVKLYVVYNGERVRLNVTQHQMSETGHFQQPHDVFTRFKNWLLSRSSDLVNIEKPITANLIHKPTMNNLFAGLKGDEHYVKVDVIEQHQRLTGIDTWQVDLNSIAQPPVKVLCEKNYLGEVATGCEVSKDQYYFTKPIDPAIIVGAFDVNPQYLTGIAWSDQRWEINRIQITEWLKRNQQPVRNGKNGTLIPLQNHGQVLKTGFDYVECNQRGLDKIWSYEWSAQSLHNKIYAIYYRNFGSRTTPSNEGLGLLDRTVNQFMQWFRPRFKDEYDKCNVDQFNPLRWLEARTDFSVQKRAKYQHSIVNQLSGIAQYYHGSFMNSLKSGEENFINESSIRVENGFLSGASSKPRGIQNPSRAFCGLFTAMQSTWWEPLKKVLPGFVQGLTKKEQEELVRRHCVDKNTHRVMWVVCRDGSGFDSTQYSRVRRLVVNRVVRFLIDCFFDRCDPVLFQQVLDNRAEIVEALLDDSYILFTQINGLKDQPAWPQAVIDAWNRDWADVYGRYSPQTLEQFLFFNIQGTTFSGIPMTTISNTFMTIFYQYVDLISVGIDAPWTDPTILVMASGDDGCIFCVRVVADRLKIFIPTFHTDDKNLTQPMGLGQVVTELSVVPWYQVDFCSKIAYGTDDAGDCFQMTRDYEKCLKNKQYYCKKDRAFLRQPWLHPYAILKGLQTEQGSQLVEDMLSVRVEYMKQFSDPSLVKEHNIEMALVQVTNPYNPFCSPTSYHHEHDINRRLGIDIGDLLRLIKHHKLYAGLGREHEQSASLQQLQKHNNNNFSQIIINFNNVTNMAEQQQENNIDVVQYKGAKKPNKKYQGQRPRYKPYNPTNASQDLKDFDEMRQISKLPKSYSQLKNIEADKAAVGHDALVTILDTIHAKYRNSLKPYFQVLGLKTIQNLDPQFDSMSIIQKRKALELALADDLPPQVLAAIAHYGPQVLNSLWNQLRKTKPMKAVFSKMNDLFGLDLNDDLGSNSKFTFNPRQGPPLQWDHLSSDIAESQAAFDGVNTQAISAVLFPEFERTRLPSDTSIKTGIYSRVYTITVSTNASGNAAFVIYPHRLSHSSLFTQIFNDSSYNPETGSQSSAATQTAGLISGFGGITACRVAACSMQLQCISSVLNTQGRIIQVMSGGATNSNPETTQLPFTVDNARDKEYVTYTAMQNISGHRMSYVNNDQEPGAFSDFGVGANGYVSKDYLGFILQGGPASTQCLQVQIAISAEYTVSGLTLADIGPPPTGCQTFKCLATALSLRPDLRLLGTQESAQLYQDLACTPCHFNDVLRTLTQTQFKHQHLEYLVNKGARDMQVMQNQPSSGIVSGVADTARIR